MGEHLQTTDIYSNGYDDLLQTVFEDGIITKQYSFEEIRERAKVKALEVV
jgi:hypothetical protein